MRNKIFISFWTACMTMLGMVCVLYNFKMTNNQAGVIIMITALWSMEAGRKIKDWELTSTETTGCAK